MWKRSITVLALSLCARGAAAAQKPAAPKSPPTPTGTYTTTILKAELPPNFPAERADSVAGKWSLTFANGKPVIVTLNGNEVAESPVTFSDGKMNVGANDTGPDKCGSEAVYSYSEKDGILTFKTVGADQCGGRVLVLTRHPLKHGS